MPENNDPFLIPLVSFRTSHARGGGGSSSLTIQDEGSDISTNCDTINFIGSDVEVLQGSSNNIVQVYIPPPTFASHWNTSDGTTNASVSESGISRSTTRISEPTSEGNPFSVGTWGNTNNSTTESSGSSNNTTTYTTSGLITGFGTGSNFEIKLLDANGTSSLETFTTGAITTNNVFTSSSGYIIATVTNYQSDTTRFKANISIQIQFRNILIANSRDGGKVNVSIVMTAGDGTGTYPYTSTAFFSDENPNTPSISGSATIQETSGQVVTRHLSGIEYYTTNSKFTVGITGIDNLNRNTARTTNNVQINATNYGLSQLNTSPFGTNSSKYTNWTIAYNNTGAEYNQSDYTLNSTSHRFRGTNASLSAIPKDTWDNGSTVTSSNASILIDCVTTTASSDLYEGFVDENRRQDSTFNTGATAGNWNSTQSLAANEAAVFNGQLMSPQSMTLSNGSSQTDFALFKPDLNGANPNYTGIVVPVNYYRTIVDTSGNNRASFTMTFTGNFVSNATTDLANSNLEIFISRRASANGGRTGYNNANFLEMHGVNYNFATFNDGTTDGHIRLASSSGNTVNCTFGGLSCEQGFYMHIKINNSLIRLSSLQVTFA
jgi:hypothetical protein